MIGVEHDLQLKDIINAPYQAFTAPQQVGRRPDTQQVRLLKKRLGISADDLLRTVEKVGDSIAAISKEVEVQKVSALRETIPASAKEISVTAPTLTPLVENSEHCDEIR